MRRKLATLITAALLAASSTAHAIAYIQANCTVDGLGARCVFTNTGADAGSACATMRLSNRYTTQSIDSALLCSTTLQPGASVTLPAVFPGAQPMAVCLPGGPTQTLNNCSMNVTMSNAQMAGSSNGWSALLGLLVIVSTIWVYADAKKIGARKGLIPGMGNTSPEGWALACFALWIVVFPLYLLKRGAIKAAAQAAGGAPPGGAMPMGFGQGMPPQGGFGPPGSFGQGMPPQGGMGPGAPPPGGFGPPGGFPPQGRG
jgi:hypothetical protein